MKKAGIGILILVFAAGAGYWFFFRPGQAGLPIEKVLPGEPLFVFEARDIQTHWQEWTSTPFWRQMEALDWDGLFKKTAETPEAYEKYLEVKNNLAELSRNEYLKKFFDRQTAVILYPAVMDFERLTGGSLDDVSKTLEQMFSSVVLISRIPVDLQVMELISRFPKVLGEQITTDATTYKGQSIHRIHTAEGLMIAYARFQDVMVMGLGEDAARNAIDAYLGETGTLENDPRYRAARQSALSARSWWAYFNMKDTLNSLNADMASLQNTLWKQSSGDPSAPDGESSLSIDRSWQDVVDRFSGFESFSLSSALGESVFVKAVMKYRLAQMTPEMRAFYENCHVSENQSLEYIPLDVLGYQWGNCLNLALSWKQVQKEMDKMPKKDGSMDTRQQIEELEQKIGLSIEKDILSAFGDEYGGFLNDINTQSVFPIPEFGLFIKVRDRQAMDRLLAKLGEIPMVTLKDENYGTARIQSIVTPLGDMVQPSFAYLGDYLFLAISRTLLKNVIDVSQNRQGLAQDPLFRKIRPDLTAKSIGIQFVRVGRLTGKLSGLVEWGNSWANSRIRQKQAFASGGEQRLNDVRLKKENLREVIRGLEDDLWDLETRPYTEDIRAQIETLRQDLDLKRVGLAELQEQETELAATVEDLAGRKDESAEQQRRFLVDAFVYPVLKAFETIPAMGAQTRMSDGALEVEVDVQIGVRP